MSFHYGRKPSTLRALVFTVGKKLQLKTSQLNARISLYMMNIIKWFHHDIRKLIKDDEFANSMKDLDFDAWTTFDDDVVKNFLGNRQDENYNELVEKLLKNVLDIVLYTRIINMLIYTYTCSYTHIHIYAGYILTQ